MPRENLPKTSKSQKRAPKGSVNNPWIRVKKHKSNGQIIPECYYLLRPSGIWRISPDKLPKNAFVENLKLT